MSYNILYFAAMHPHDNGMVYKKAIDKENDVLFSTSIYPQS